ncbi:uncharacterized protein LOC109363722 isoform X2 [Meleagris gallopavo]|uniref:uncharacterized protein LOC109363722 isoform X2 n=1 Tax=Meleagris gallopavo TaxID=9103 RepID=UPI0012AC385F|nr:uncharacterized protein LOC109363722 isoform X2 [Meleagris gallopavo]
MEGILQPSRSDGGWGLIRALGRVSRWEPTLGLSPSSSEWPHLPPFPSRSSRPGRRMHGAGRRLPWQRHHGNVTMATAPWQRGRDGTRPGDARCAALRSDRHDHGTEPGRDSEPVKLPGDSSHAGVSSTLRRDTTKGWKGLSSADPRAAPQAVDALRGCGTRDEVDGMQEGPSPRNSHLQQQQQPLDEAAHPHLIQMCEEPFQAAPPPPDLCSIPTSSARRQKRRKGEGSSQAKLHPAALRRWALV